MMRPHHHAMFHTLFMFFGIATCLPIDFYWRRVDKTMPPLPKVAAAAAEPAPTLTTTTTTRTMMIRM